MFAVVSFKTMEVREVVPLEWIYNYKVSSKLRKETMITFYSDDFASIRPKIPGLHSNNIDQIPVSGNFYKINVEQTFGKHEKNIFT